MTRRSLRGVIVVAVALGFFGCKTKRESPPDVATLRQVDKPAPAIAWHHEMLKLKRSKSFYCARSCWLSFRPALRKKTTLDVTVFSIPVGTEVTLGGKVLKVDKDTTKKPVALGGIEITDRLGSVPLGALDYDKLDHPGKRDRLLVDLGVDVKVKLPGIEPIVTKVPRQDVAGVALRVLQQVRRAPLTVAKKASAKKTAVIVRQRTSYLVRLGDPQTLADARWVAVIDDIRRDGLKCRGYRKKGGKLESLMMVRNDAKVTIVEAASGKKIEEKLFPLKQKKCPKPSTERIGGVLRVPPAPLKKWVEGRIKKMK